MQKRLERQGQWKVSAAVLAALTFVGGGCVSTPRSPSAASAPEIPPHTTLSPRDEGDPSPDDVETLLVEGSRLIAEKPNEPDGYLVRGSARAQKEEYAGAIADFDRAIALEPNSPLVHVARGIAHIHVGDFGRAAADFEQAYGAEVGLALAHMTRGRLRTDRGEYEDAIADFTRVIEIQPENAVAFARRADARRELEDFKNAIADYDRALSLDPGDAIAQDHRAFCKQNLGALADALADYDDLVSKAPDYARGRMNRGVVKRQLGQRAAALADFEKAIELDPNEALGYYNRGFIRQLNGDKAGALADYDRCIALDPLYPHAYRWRGVLWGERQDYQRAVADLTKALELRVDDTAIRSEIFADRGRVHIALRNVDAAETDFRQAIVTNPKDPDGYVGLARVKIDRNDFAGAKADCDVAIGLGTDADYFYWRAKALHGLDRIPEALADADRAAELDPNHQTVFSLRQRMRAQQGDYQGALEDANRWVEQHPSAAGFASRGGYKENLNDLPGAIADYDRAIQIEPQTGRYYHARAFLKQSANDLPGAQADLEQALASPDAQSSWWVDLGRMRAKSGDSAGAQAALQRALAHGPTADALSFKGELKSKQRDIRGAAEAWEQAAELEPGDRNYRLMAGTARMMLGETTRALALFDAAVQANPDDPLAFARRARARAQLNDFDGALSDVNRALAVEPESDEFKLMREEVRAMLRARQPIRGRGPLR